MKSLAYSLAAAALLCVASIASAQVTPTTPPAPGAQPVTPAAPASATRSLPPTRWTALQIQQSFEFADNNSNGELTRAEAQQLAIMPLDFETMDENKDGVVTRAEYEAIFAR